MDVGALVVGEVDEIFVLWHVGLQDHFLPRRQNEKDIWECVAK